MKKKKTLSIGPFPLISLLEAREARDDAKRLLLEGIDPMVEKKKKKLTTIQNYQNTFKFVALDWYDNRKHKRADYIDSITPGKVIEGKFRKAG